MCTKLSRTSIALISSPEKPGKPSLVCVEGWNTCLGPHSQNTEFKPLSNWSVSCSSPWFPGYLCVCVCVCVSCAVMSNSAIPWTVAHQAPLSKGFSRQEYWSRLPFHLHITTWYPVNISDLSCLFPTQFKQGKSYKGQRVISTLICASLSWIKWVYQFLK